VNEFQDRTALVTGGAGFVGSHLARRLVGEGARVVVLDNLSSGSRENIQSTGIDFVLGDVRDSALVKRLVEVADWVFHLAEYIPQTLERGPGHVVKYSVENPLSEFDVGCRGTLVVLEECREHKKPLIFSSSAAVYGEAEGLSFTERSPTSPASPYGASKLCAETYVELYSRLHHTPTTILRLFNVYGPLQRKYVLHDILLRLFRDPTRIEMLGTGDEQRDFVFVEDAVDAMLLVANNEECIGQIYNVGTGVGTSIRQVVRLVSDNLDIDPQLVFSGTSWRGDVKALVANTAKIKGIGYQPRYKLVDGIKSVIEWYKSECDSR
jgi:UDP-glucose 4-epimerase